MHIELKLREQGWITSFLCICIRQGWWNDSCFCPGHSGISWGPSIKDIGVFGPFLLPPSPMSEFQSWFAWPLPSNILQHRNLRPPTSPPLKYSDVFYGWPLARQSHNRLLQVPREVVGMECISAGPHNISLHPQYIWIIQGPNAQWSKWPNFVSLHYWRASRGAMGVKKSKPPNWSPLWWVGALRFSQNWRNW